MPQPNSAAWLRQLFDVIAVNNSSTHKLQKYSMKCWKTSIILQIHDNSVNIKRTLQQFYTTK